jgi:hypothetical protein
LKLIKKFLLSGSIDFRALNEVFKVRICIHFVYKYFWYGQQIILMGNNFTAMILRQARGETNVE